jgi:hypothetical protein
MNFAWEHKDVYSDEGGRISCPSTSVGYGDLHSLWKIETDTRLMWRRGSVAQGKGRGSQGQAMAHYGTGFYTVCDCLRYTNSSDITDGVKWRAHV